VVSISNRLPAGPEKIRGKNPRKAASNAGQTPHTRPSRGPRRAMWHKGSSWRPARQVAAAPRWRGRLRPGQTVASRMIGMPVDFQRRLSSFIGQPQTRSVRLGWHTKSLRPGKIPWIKSPLY